ncbi:uncharacterized protein [Oryza sativa Japonica Group]|uniref:OSJNBa0033G05.9 protein n=6 Tax=Oryza TaxID=4527 RepID=Q7XTN3_ORYSJ|nr:uncharacterized protein LOC9271328 isoform X1 [Oryza sativa Japonica Group]XP_052151682.1 uncharacterized protein LOC127770058 isoform X1 [Oryza glaberrima]KAF2936149.1 hypothetical protein DAI22_04g283100 [Oryza sativa Japonica Group]CAD41908.2 OSJNBa0033G05.9 [Oryza sativa Japonica Group]CAH68244.1 H0306F03.11 [Oryza sativa]
MHTRTRTSLLALASLLLLLLATRAHGIRLDRQLHEAINNKQEIMRDSKAEQSLNTARLMNKHCTSDGHCNSGKVQRPVVQAEAGAAAKQQQQNQSLERSGDANQQEQETAPRQQEKTSSTATATMTTYPDILDIAGMDYSPATRKPPIHN